MNSDYATKFITSLRHSQTDQFTLALPVPLKLTAVCREGVQSLQKYVGPTVHSDQIPLPPHSKESRWLDCLVYVQIKPRTKITAPGITLYCTLCH